MTEGPIINFDWLRIVQRGLTVARELRGDTKIDADGRYDRPRARSIKERLLALQEIEERKYQQQEEPTE